VRIRAIIPAFNEAPYVGAVVRETRRFVDSVVLVDDGSTDGTGAVAEAAGAVWVRNPVRLGKGAAIRRGIAASAEGGFTHLLFLDGDGQHNPHDIPALLRVAEESGADLVIGARPFVRGEMPLARYFSNTWGSLLTSRLVGQEIRDSQCGFRLYRWERLRRLNLTARRYEIEMECLIKLARSGGSIAHAPVGSAYISGQGRSKMRVVRDTVRICLYTLRYRVLGV
jgi:glycosyltransferase involved in cell wall biosynthesis